MIQQIQPNQVTTNQFFHTSQATHLRIKDGNPLKPVDPNDPTKGYEVPSVPTNPGEDTPINYVQILRK